MTVLKEIFEKEEIRKIINEIKEYDFQNPQISDHFKIRALQRDYSIEEMKEIFPKFEKIKMIRLRKLKYGDGYELLYTKKPLIFGIPKIHLSKECFHLNIQWIFMIKKAAINTFQ